MSKENTRREFLTAALAVGASAIIPAQAIAQTAAGIPAGRLTLHAIDTFHGSPGGGMRIDLNIRDGDSDQYRLVKSFVTNPGGRSDSPLLEGAEFASGRYELMLHVGDYFAGRGVQLPKPTFLSKVPIRFAVADNNQRYHVPVLFSPWGYSYYRGS